MSTSWPHRHSSFHLPYRPNRKSDVGVVGTAPVEARGEVTVAQSLGSSSHRGHRRNVSSGGRLENVVPNLSDPVSPTSSGKNTLRKASIRRPAALHPLMDEDSMSDSSLSDEEDVEVLSPQQLLARSLASQQMAKSSTSLPPPSADRVRRLITSWCTAEEQAGAESTHGQVQAVIVLIQSYIGKWNKSYVVLFAWVAFS